MTKKDYELIAKALKGARVYDGQVSMTPEQVGTAKTHNRAIETAARHIGNELAKQNERFDFVRFLKACGVEA